MALLPNIGDRVRMVGIMADDPDPIPMGEEGAVTSVSKFFDGTAQIFVKWDSGRSLILLDSDPFVVIR